MVTSGANVWVSVEESLNLNKMQHAVGTGEKTFIQQNLQSYSSDRSMNSVHW